MRAYAGPEFDFVAEQPAQRSGPARLEDPARPLLLRGALKLWPAWSNWTFHSLGRLRHPDGSEVRCRFQEGLVEQGATQPLPVLPVGPYLEQLERDARRPRSSEIGLLPESRRRMLESDDRFRLDWSYLARIEKGRRYLADWPILKQFPELRRDFAIATLWPGWRWTWEYVFIGPADTVTGLHQDIHDNWFCQIRGTKEVLLFSREQSAHLFASSKYNLGSVLSEIDILNLEEQPARAEEFGKTRGSYARVKAGDALYIPKDTWHAVISLEPSISLGVFGLTAWEILTAGAWSEVKNLFHLARLYRWRNCICHESPAGGTPSGRKTQEARSDLKRS